MTVRDAVLSDAADLENLWFDLLTEQAALERSLSVAADARARFRADFPVWLKDTTRVTVIAENGGQAVGFAMGGLWSLPPVFVEVREVFLEHMFVAGAHRRKGAGRALLQHVLRWSASLGAEIVRLDVLSTNQGGKGFWKSVSARPFSETLVLAVRDAGSKPVRLPLGFTGNT